MSLEAILGLLGSGLGVFLLKLYADWRNAKRGDKQDAVGAWQQIADREAARMKQLEERVAILEKKVIEKDLYIAQLEKLTKGAHLTLPVADKTQGIKLPASNKSGGIDLPDIAPKKPKAPSGDLNPIDDKFDL